jgi:hypothetical protein
MMRWILIIIVAACLLVGARADAQHLWWDVKGHDGATCLYGEVTVLATHEGVYYCGANWHPGEPAGGYCGIQHNSLTERRTIFSVWDTSPKLRPTVTEAEAKTVFNRFGGEGEGAHTHVLLSWQVGETFQFFLQKQPGSEANTTDARYFFYDRQQKAWRHSATITSPNGDERSAKSVALFGGGLASFLENFAGSDREVPKLALYRLWIGTSVSDLKCLTRAQGDGTWGQLHDAYFLAEGDGQQLQGVFDGLGKQYGKPAIPEPGRRLEPVVDRPLSAEVVNALNNLPRAARVAPK